MTRISVPGNGGYRWPEEGLTHIPDWVYTSDEIFARERERIFPRARAHISG